MRALSENIFHKYLDKLEITNGTNNTINMFDKSYIDEALFGSGKFAYIRLENICEPINSIAISNTNACFIIVHIKTTADEERYFVVDIQDKIENINIAQVEIKSIEISFYKNKNIQENIKCRYLIAGKAIDFPPHSKKKIHKLINNHQQFFSQSGNYFVRHLPLKKYATWTVAFDLLTNKDKNTILDFFENNNYETFILQVWKESDKSYYKSNPLLIRSKNISPIKCGSLLNSGIYKRLKNILERHRKNTGIKKYEMKMGFYVCTNKDIDFKKGDNDIYQWSTSLSFREIF